MTRSQENVSKDASQVGGQILVIKVRAFLFVFHMHCFFQLIFSSFSSVKKKKTSFGSSDVSSFTKHHYVYNNKNIA